MISQGKKSQCTERERGKASRGYESQGFGESWRNKKKEWSVLMLVKSPKKRRKEQGDLEYHIYLHNPQVGKCPLGWADAQGI